MDRHRDFLLKERGSTADRGQRSRRIASLWQQKGTLTYGEEKNR